MKVYDVLLFLLLLAISQSSVGLIKGRRWLMQGQNQFSELINRFSENQKDLNELIRLKKINGMKSFTRVIQSSMTTFGIYQEEPEFDLEENVVKGRQVIYGTCTCISTSFSCYPTTYLGYLLDIYLPSTTSYISTCSASSTCSTICSSVSFTCLQSCTIFTSLTAVYYTSYSFVSETGAIPGVFTFSSSFTTSAGSSTSSSITIYSVGCESLSTACSTTTSNRLARVAVAVAAVAAIAVVGVGAGVGMAQAQLGVNNQQQPQQVQQQVANFPQNTVGRSVGVVAPTPNNNLPIPVTGPNFRNDGGCDDESIVFNDGNCYPVLRRGPCTDGRQWITVDPLTLRVDAIPFFI